jgi:hypothetical protein
MKIKDELRELILDRFTLLTTTMSFSLPVLLSLLSIIEDKPNLLFLSVYLFVAIFIFINSVYVLVARKSKPDILIVRSIDNIKKDEIEGKTTAKYPILQSYARKSLLLSIAMILISFFTPSFRQLISFTRTETPIVTSTIIPTQLAITPTVTVIYKSPAEMNLQPGDIPDLNMTYVQNPSAEPFIPEATNQSQLAYTNDTSTNYIETNVLITPAKTNRTPVELFDLTVEKRRPSIQKVSSELPLQIGEQAFIYETNDECGPGYVLIVIRSNIITVVIACGENVNLALVEKIGTRIDNNITFNGEAFELTPEEQSVAGYHNYLGKGTMFSDHCGFGDSISNKTEEREEGASFDFSGKGTFRGLYNEHGVIYYRTDVNTYVGFLNVEGYALQQITFNITMNGFTELHIYVDGICNQLHEYTRID